MTSVGLRLAGGITKQKYFIYPIASQTKVCYTIRRSAGQWAS